MQRGTYPLTIGLLGLAGMVLFGCGGGTGETGRCGVEPCGGSLVGRWVFSNRCGTTTQSVGICAVVDLSALDMSGESLVFNADLTYLRTGPIAGSLTVTVPPGCGATDTCDQTTPPLTLTLEGGTATSVDCASGSGGCRCTFHYSPQPSAESGTYATDGRTLTLTKLNGPLGGAPSPSGYCAEESWLTISAMNQAGDTGQTVWRKN